MPPSKGEPRRGTGSRLSLHGRGKLCRRDFAGGELRDEGRINFAGGDQLREHRRIDFARREKCGRGGGDLRIGGSRAGCVAHCVIEADDKHILAGVVDGDVLAGLEKAQLADALGGDAGGGEVSYAAGVELDADVGDVNFWADDGQADGAHLAHRRIGEGEDDVQIVDHQVKDDIDIEGAGGEDGEAMGLKEHGAAEPGLDGEHGGIEALEMAGLQDAPALFGAGYEVFGFGQARGQRLLDQQVEARGEERGSDGMVMNRGNGDGGCMEGEAGGEELVNRRKDRDCVLRGGFCGAGGVRLDDGCQSHTGASRLQLAVDAEMIAAKGSGPGHGDAEDGIAD